MSNDIANKAVGAAKQLAAGIVGDGKPREEGTAQAQRKPSSDGEGRWGWTSKGQPAEPVRDVE